MKTFGPRGTYSRSEQDQPAEGKSPALPAKAKNSRRGAKPTTARGTAEETEARRLSSQTVEPPNRAEIDPLRVLVWTAFAAVLVLAWVAIVWTVTAL